MGESNGESHGKLWFPTRLRDLRVAARKRQKDVASAVGLKPSTYANAESAQFRRLKLDRVMALAKFYGLGQVETDELVAGWNAMPESEYNKRNAEPWAARDERRSKLKAHDKLKLSLLEVTALLITLTPDPDTLCSCPAQDDLEFGAPAEPSPPCEICTALALVGIRGGNNTARILVDLAAAQEKMVNNR